MYFILQTGIFHCYVSLPEGIPIWGNDLLQTPSSNDIFFSDGLNFNHLVKYNMENQDFRLQNYQNYHPGINTFS